MSERRGTKALETWCRRLTEGYPGVKVENMTTSWRDGLAFCAIIHHFRPDLIDFASLNPTNIYYNNSLAFNIAERQLGIPALLDAEDMVMYSVPDRLSILTYLSQFYQVFGTQTATGAKQGTTQRIVPKRPAISSDIGIISPASSSAPTKVASRSSSTLTGSRREPCAKCAFPVFLAERLNVGSKLYHRTCFRCARCHNQLSLANYYETETEGQYCCETCPDEEESPNKMAKFDSLDNVKSISESEVKNSAESLDTDSRKLAAVRNRSLSDEEKSKGLQKFDDYSQDFEHTLERDIEDKEDSALSKARTHFLSSHLLNEDPPSYLHEPPNSPEGPPNNTDVSQVIPEPVNYLNVPQKKVDHSDDSQKCLDGPQNNSNGPKNNSDGPKSSLDGLKSNSDLNYSVSPQNRLENLLKGFQNRVPGPENILPSPQKSLNTPKNSINKPDLPPKEELKNTESKDDCPPPLPVSKPPDNLTSSYLPVKPPDLAEDPPDYPPDNPPDNPSDNPSDDTPDKADNLRNKMDNITDNLSENVDLVHNLADNVLDNLVDNSVDNLAHNPTNNLEDNLVDNPTDKPVDKTVDYLEEHPDISNSHLVTHSITSSVNPTDIPADIPAVIPPDNAPVNTPINPLDNMLDNAPDNPPYNAQDNAPNKVAVNAPTDYLPHYSPDYPSDNPPDASPTNLSDNLPDNLSDKLSDGLQNQAPISLKVKPSLATVESDASNVNNVNSNEEAASEDKLEEKTKDSTQSLVKKRMLIFEEAMGNNKNTNNKFKNDKKDSKDKEDKEDSKVPLFEDTTSTVHSVSSEDVQYKTVKSDVVDSLILYASTISEAPLDNSENISVFEDSSIQLDPSLLDDTQYPEDLNPFGDEDPPVGSQAPPFKSPRKEELKKIKPSMEDLTIITPPKQSTNPFGSSDDEDPEPPVRQKPPRPPQPAVREGKKVVQAPRVSLNPFWSDDEEPQDDVTGKPVPMPRSKNLTPEPRPRISGLSNTASHYDSNSSLSSLNSSHTPGRRKKPAPAPPTQGTSLTPEGSKQSSPSTSTHPSPKLTPRIRKTRKAPLPPSSTPFVSSHSTGDTCTISPICYDQFDPKPIIESVLSPIGSDIEKEKISKDEKNRNRQSQTIPSPVLSDSDSQSMSQQCSSSDKSTHGKWKRRKGPAPARPVPQRRQIRPLPLVELRRELDIIEMQQQGLEKQGVKLEQLIREKCEIPGNNDETALDPEVEDLVLELFELVNEKNELFRRQAELMYLRRQQRLEEEHADLEYQIRCLMERPERNKTDTDKAREEELINRLLEVVERRNEIVECLEMDRVREAEEDQSINTRLSQLASKKEETVETPVKLSKKEKKKMKKEKKMKEKGKNLDVDKDIDESETASVKEKKKKKWF